ncbi:MAG TPA: oligopeptide/dipeptide ABC transporter ATP-binding protein [Beijerinckiaceae bacterium]|nr:oligopeptide/dipeptide ABC transporter ATP-binding protein [Beijerinckiaceae bacterium]
MPADDILACTNLTTLVGGRRRFLRPAPPPLRAVDDVSFAVRRGETFGIVGESGSGKTTLGRTLAGLLGQSEGDILLDGKLAEKAPPRRARRLRRDIQFLHQDATAALDPWWSIGNSLAEPLAFHGLRGEAATRIAETLPAVGLDPSLLDRLPHELSGGQAKRVALARLLMLRPKILILDEPTAGLDLSVQAAVLQLLVELKRKFDLTTLFISHDLSVVRLICNRAAVMLRGRIVEIGGTKQLFARPRHPYTQLLMAATPQLVPRRDLSPAADPPPLPAAAEGCAFSSRCPHAVELCCQERPNFSKLADGSTVACHRWREITDAALPA